MKKMQRREFFQHLTHSVADSINTSLFSVKESSEEARPSWTRLTRFSEMAPGKNSPFEVLGVKGVLQSDEIGLRARREDGSCAAVRATSDGFIEVNVNEYWPFQQVLSHATGAAVLSE